MTKTTMAFFGSSLVSSYWNGAATYYRGILRAFAARGYDITFYEPDAFERQRHRDIDDPPWARVVVYPADEESVLRALESARGSDVIVKASGVGVFDEFLEREVLSLKGHEGAVVLFWDVDAPATLERLQQLPDDPFHELIPQYDMILTYGGGPRVVNEYTMRGARRCVPIYNALDPDQHFPVPRDDRFHASLSLLANRLPDRETRVHEFFFKPAMQLVGRQFLLAGSGWHDNSPSLPNVRYIGHLPTRDHNAFNSTPMAVLNINRQSMARYGYSPATRIFEAAGAGACLISDRWEGIDTFLEPDREILLASNGHEVAEHLQRLTLDRARTIGEAARRRVMAQHTYRQRAELLEQILFGNTEVYACQET